MTDRFISSEELEEARRKRQEEWERVRKPDDPEQAPEEEVDNRSLYDRLQEVRNKKQVEHDEEHKLKNAIRGLDAEESDFLAHIDEARAKQEALRKKEEQDLIKQCRENAVSSSTDEPSLSKIRLSVSGGVKNVSKQAKLLGGAIRKRPSSDMDVKADSKKAKPLIGEGKLPTKIKVVGAIPGIQQYSPSSDSDSSSGSDDDGNLLPILIQSSAQKKGNGCQDEE